MVLAERPLNINKLPSPTWRWLKMNGCSVPLGELVPFDVQNGSPCKAGDKWNFDTGSGKEVDKLLDDIGVKPQRFNAGANDKLRFAFDLEKKPAAYFEFEVPKGSSSSVVMDFHGRGCGVVQSRFKIADDADFTLIQIHKLDKGSKFINDVGAFLSSNSHFRVVQLVVSGGELYLGNCSSLKGEGSSLESGLGYLCSEGEKLDVNYVALHEGEHTLSDIRAYGSLRENGEKLFRGTIDFRHGAIGAKGAETEDALLIDDNCVNRTVPLILCEEEDVEGTHGATIGRLDDGLMFYLNSRGLDKDEVYRIMSNSRLIAACRFLSDEALRQEVLSEIGGKEE